ncbi:hypothetical protein AVEN_70399-1, partial [Araneus ventricosus]
KGGKYQRLASFYRPISLLPTIGKVLEKLMTQRLTYHLEATKQNERPTVWLQRRIDCGCSSQRAAKKDSNSKKRCKHVLALSIDIKGEFDKLHHPAVLTSLDASTCPIKITKLFHNLLQNKKVTLLTPQGRATTDDQKQGCPQGSCSGQSFDWVLSGY